MLPLVIVFAKAPRPGFVKTRLRLEPTEAASLYSGFVRQTLQNVSVFRDEATLELSLDMECEAWAEFSIPRTIQREGSLGARLYAAFESGLSTGHPKVLILGSDSPTLPVEYIRYLLNSNADVTLGPTLDGGYYGIACRDIRPTMFEGVSWSTSDALQDTIRSVERCGLSCTLGPRWFDIDTAEDLRRFTEAGRGESGGT